MARLRELRASVSGMGGALAWAAHTIVIGDFYFPKKISSRKQKKKLIPKYMVDLSSTIFLSSPNEGLISP